MIILAIDPGTLESGWVLHDTSLGLQASGVFPNAEMLEYVALIAERRHSILAIEMIASYGMPVGREVFETVLWIGRYIQVWSDPDDVRLIYRQEVKLHLCKDSRAKDANIRQALLDLVGPQGTKKAPGPTYGIKSHAWAALAVAMTAAHKFSGEFDAIETV